MALTMDRIPAANGIMKISEDGAVMNSSGELQNREDLATVFLSLARRCGQLLHQSDDQFKRLTGQSLDERAKRYYRSSSAFLANAIVFDWQECHVVSN